MKIVVLEFDDTVDTSALILGATPTVTIGTTNIIGGIVLTSFPLPNPPAPTLVPHIHSTLKQEGGFAVPESSTGPAQPI